MLSLKELDERIEKCQKILTQDPQSKIFAALAEAYRKKGELKKASQICARGLGIHPNYASAHLVMAKIHLDMENFKEAENEVELVSQLEGESTSLGILLSEILIKKGEKDKARIWLGRLLVQEPENQTIKNLLGTFFNITDFKAYLDLSQSEGRSFPNLKIPGIRPESKFPERTEPKIRQTLEYLKSLPKIFGLLLVGKDGLILESDFKIDLDQELLAAQGIAVFRAAKPGVKKVNFGELRQIVIESGNLLLLFTHLGKYFLLVCCAQDISLGTLNMQMNELVESPS